VVSQQPYVTTPSDRLIGYFRNAVGIGQTARPQSGQNGVELIALEADQIEVETGELELPQLAA
jgi:hypothetical protein